ncbi:hypothetical protein HHI36_014759 [Cryptolaemus montrouzieri]|uniref:Uncharacterized protein n=1 Tax=Cryptolaemus montrouzieri TaxID=559131 RepID=A0ABD2N3X8_9CUCU
MKILVGINNFIRDLQTDEIETYYLETVSEQNELISKNRCWRVDNVGQFTLSGNRTFYSGGNLNQADRVLVYVKETIDCHHEVVDTRGQKVVEVTFRTAEGEMKMIAVYRSHEINVRIFMNALEDFLFNEKRTKCNFSIDDLNIDIASEEA